MEKSEEQIETEGMFSVRQRQPLSKITLYQMSGTGMVMFRFGDVLLHYLPDSAVSFPSNLSHISTTEPKSLVDKLNGSLESSLHFHLAREIIYAEI